MRQHHKELILLLAALVLVLASLACGLGQVGQTQQPIWTPAPVTAAPLAAGNILPTAAVAAQTPFVAAVTPDIPLATRVTLATSVPLATSAPTVDPHLVIITETDITNAIAGGGVEGAGVHVENLAVRFTAGKAWITAGQVSYSLISVQNLAVVGRLVARDGALQMETESVSPQGLVSAMIPGLINQALKQYTSQWYVESVQTFEGWIEVRIR